MFLLAVAALGGVSVPLRGQHALDAAGYTNWLGMKFVPVGERKFSFLYMRRA